MLKKKNNIVYRLKQLYNNLEKTINILNINITDSYINKEINEIIELQEIVNYLIDKLDDYLDKKENRLKLEGYIDEIEEVFKSKIIKIKNYLME